VTTPNPTTSPSAGTPAPETAPPRWNSYVAVGDSFSEGLWDPYPGQDDHQRGWADLLAQHLAVRRVAAGDEPLRYANLAIRGRKLRSILTEQVPAALALQPDLVSVIGGGNDILRPNADVDRLARNLEHAVARLRAAGIDVLMGTGFDASHSPLVGLTRSRVGVYNAHIWAIARRQGAYVVDLWGLRALQDWRMWSDDRIHLTPEGHRRVAQAALVGLGQAPDDAAWDDPLTPLPPSPAIDRARQHGQWVRAHVGPWVQRRLTGTSSGDGRLPKAPELLPVPLAEG
jgi:lysophospholipase L1-like esterase